MVAEDSNVENQYEPEVQNNLQLGKRMLNSRTKKRPSALEFAMSS